MRVGSIVIGKINSNEYDVKPYIAGSIVRDSLLAYKYGMSAGARDTIELFDPVKVKGMIVKIDSDISGYGIKIAQVLLERRTVWFNMNDLELLPNPNKTT